jgi:hypothetical protein
MRAHDHRGDIFRRALNHRLHAAVEPIAHPAGDVKLPRLMCYVMAKSYALHAAGDDEVFGIHVFIRGLFPWRRYFAAFVTTRIPQRIFRGAVMRLQYKRALTAGARLPVLPWLRIKNSVSA